MHFWGVVMGVVNIIMGMAHGRYHQPPVGVAMVPEGYLKKLEPMGQARTESVIRAIWLIFKRQANSFELF